MYKMSKKRMGSPKKHAPLKTHLQNNTTSTLEPGYQEAAFPAWEYCFNHPVDHQDNTIGLETLKETLLSLCHYLYQNGYQ